MADGGKRKGGRLEKELGRRRRRRRKKKRKRKEKYHSRKVEGEVKGESGTGTAAWHVGKGQGLANFAENFCFPSLCLFPE